MVYASQGANKLGVCVASTVILEFIRHLDPRNFSVENRFFYVIPWKNITHLKSGAKISYDCNSNGLCHVTMQLKNEKSVL